MARKARSGSRSTRRWWASSPTHSGFSHGGNGFEGIQLLLEQFAGHDVADPGNPNHGLDLAEGARAIPGVNHPVFRGKPANTDPREAFVAALMAERRDYNLFHEYYRALVQALYEQSITNNVFCVNIDGVIAAWLLKLL